MLRGAAHPSAAVNIQRRLPHASAARSPRTLVPVDSTQEINAAARRRLKTSVLLPVYSRASAASAVFWSR